jgi:VIT1/CCC1 family predicted Fe2+/Mn2+ transporter
VFPIALGGAMWVALALSAISLFGIGVFAARLSARNPVAKGLEIVAFGAGVFAISYAAGRYIPPLFGHAAIGVGG